MRFLSRSWPFLLGIALIALHVLDDSFLHPQPGTSPGDHLVSGLVPIAVLGLAAWAHPRLRGGRQGALALSFGVLGIAAGIEAAHYTGKVGASGDDYTGLLCIPAGVWLLGVGAVTLWRTRRAGDALARRYGRRLVLGVAGAVVFLFVVVPIGLAYVETHVGRAVVPPARLGTAHEDVSFPTSDGLRLKGWYVPSRNGATVIVFPGRKGPQAPARMLARHGYGVLLFDRRGEGESDGDPNTKGWGGEKDIKAAIAFLRRRPEVDPDRIGGLGLSVGGEMMMEAAAEMKALKAVVAEGAGIRSLHEHLAAPGGQKWVLAPFQAVTTAAISVFAGHAPPPSLETLAGRIAPRPLLLITAEKGQGGEMELGPVFARAAGPTATHWQVPGASHMGAIRTQPREYERRVASFFDEGLAP